MTLGRALALAIPLLAGGCQLLPIAGAGAGVSGLALAWRDAGIALEVVKPVTRQWCADRLKEPHDDATAAALQAFCANLPDDAAGLAEQLVAVLVALETERAGQSGASAP